MLERDPEMRPTIEQVIGALDTRFPAATSAPRAQGE